MPPLLRMPVFYVGLTLLSLTGWLVGRNLLTQQAVESSRASTPSPTVAILSSPETPAVEAAFRPSTDDPILRTPEGLQRKVVVTDLGVRPWTEARGGGFAGESLDYFGLFFVLSDPPAGSERIQIGDREGKPVGWVPQSRVLEWDSRLMAVPTPVPNRPRLRLFEEPTCLLDALAGRNCPKHDGPCPISGVEPDPSKNGPIATLGWPVLDSRSVPQPDGPPRTILKVATLVRDQTPLSPPTEPPAALVPLLKELDLAFVIDTTASMQNTIDAVKTLAKQLVDTTRRQYSGMRLRLALVEYRDHSPSYAFETRRTIDFTDPQTFEAALGQVKAAPRGDGSIEESVLTGVRSALPHEPGDDPTRLALSWPEGRAGDLATKVLVLLGDAPDHQSDPRLAIDLAERARRQRVTIASVAIPKPGVLKGSEVDRYRELWHTLAEQS
ncbi:MAG TPA: vWA domain-containing protein, partial [Isosphaeraceae bacterium]|nr:vWA domain-containing protein [Isosphaeraceae bacterium]